MHARANAGWPYLLRRAASHQAARVRQWSVLRERGVLATTSLQLAAAGAVRTAVEPAARTPLSRPVGLSDADWRAFRSRDVGALDEQFVLEVDDAVVVGRDGWVFTAAGLVSDVWQERGLPAEGLRRPVRPTADPVRLGGTTTSLLMPWSPNYYHWTLQAVPRVSLLERVLDLGDVDHWLVPPQAAAPYVGEWLDRLGVPAAARVHVASRRQSFAVDRLVVTSVPAANRCVPRWVVDDLRARSGAARDPAHPRLLFVDRPPQDKRRLTNRDAVRAVVAERGFTAVDLAGLTVAEEAAQLASADVVLGVHGAGLTNVVYCRPGTHLVEIMPANLVYPTFYRLAEVAGLRHHYVTGVEPALPWLLRFPDIDADVEVDVPALAALLDEVLEAAGAPVSAASPSPPPPP